jgi:CheY-like chemotaxis protein
MKFLKERGYMVELASNGQEAVAMYIGKKYDAILMDIQMPEVDGIEATRMIREIEKQYNIHTPIIALTAFALQGDKERFLSLGMDEYIAKPIKMEELYEKLDNITSLGVRPDLINGVALKNNGELMFITKGDIVPHDKVGATIKQISDCITELELSVDNKNTAMIEKLAHKIKELADSIDAYDLKGSAFRVELAARRGDVEGTLLCTMQLRHEFETVKKSTDK